MNGSRCLASRRRATRDLRSMPVFPDGRDGSESGGKICVRGVKRGNPGANVSSPVSLSVLQWTNQTLPFDFSAPYDCSARRLDNRYIYIYIKKFNCLSHKISIVSVTLRRCRRLPASPLFPSRSPAGSYRRETSYK